MKKRYISTGANPLSIDINDGSTLRTFDFTGGINNPQFKPPVFVTKDEKEQKLLEAHPSFGVSFILDPMMEIVPEVNTSNAEPVEVEEVTSHESRVTSEESGSDQSDGAVDHLTAVNAVPSSLKEEKSSTEDTTSTDTDVNEEEQVNAPEKSGETTSEEVTTSPASLVPSSSEEENLEQTKVPSSFKNAQEAKNWMVNNLNVSANSVRNKELLMAKADELNIKIVLETDNN